MIKKIDPFAVTNEEYNILMKKFQDYIHFISWQLIRANVKNNHTDEEEDITQQLYIAVLRTVRYYKRQVYIESCFEVIEKYAKDHFSKSLLLELMILWSDRKKHGAHTKKFGDHQEMILDYLIRCCVPVKQRPNKYQSLVIDEKFTRYMKSILWNDSRSQGRKITRGIGLRQ